MPKICYEPKSFNDDHTAVIHQANKIIREYRLQGFSLTLRQLYYQFVARDFLANKQQEYKRLGGIISAGRRAGLIDWDAIEDRTRFVRKKPKWESPQEMLEACAGMRNSYIWPFSYDMWRNQRHRVEVWIEKDALLGVIEDVCHDLDVPFFSCRGYTSDSEVWSAGRRMREYGLANQRPVVIHLGDHDPSGMDMTRDIQRRLSMFAESSVIVNRIALNMDQIEEYDPPPNPAKTNDARYASYVERYGEESWELDALEPKTMAEIIEAAVLEVRDPEMWDEMVELRSQGRKTLRLVAEQWDEVEYFVSGDDYE